MQAKYRIFWLYAVLITTLGGYAWHLHAKKKRQMAAYEQQYRTLLAAYNHLDEGISYRPGHIRLYSDTYYMPVSDSLWMKGKYIAEAAGALSNFSREELSRSLKYDPQVQEMLPRVQRHILSDSAAAAFFQGENDFADSLRMFSRKYEQELAALEPFFSNERRAAANHILDGNRPDQKALFLTLSMVRHAAAANRSLAFWHSRMPIATPFQTLIMPVPVLEGTCHRAGETIRGKVLAHSYFTNAKNLSFWVKESPVQQELRLGKFSTVFRSAGRHRLPVRIEVHNPLNGDIATYTITTTIIVCE